MDKKDLKFYVAPSQEVVELKWIILMTSMEVMTIRDFNQKVIKLKINKA